MNRSRKPVTLSFLLFLLFRCLQGVPNPLCSAGGPCKCFDDDKRMNCHGQPLEAWWDPEVYGPHTKVVNLSILATTLLGPITSLKNFPNLQELEIQQSFQDVHCRPVVDDDAFVDTQLARNLKIVKFVNVEILCTIPPGLRQLENLQNLEFCRTNLKLYSDADFDGMKNLERLTISYTIPEPSVQAVGFPAKVFSKLSNLIHLSLEGNENLQLHREIFDGLESKLIELNLKKCNLLDSHLKELEGLVHLEYLDLSDNSLTLSTYRNFFVNHPNLKYLKLNNNKGIKALDATLFTGANKLVELHVAGAEIKSFDLTFMDKTQKLTYVDGSDNHVDLYSINYDGENSKKLPKAKIHMCNSSIGYIDPKLENFLIHRGWMNVSANTTILCDSGRHKWLGRLVHCHKKHGLIYSPGTRCLNGEEHSFAKFLESEFPLVCKGVKCLPATLGVIILIMLSLRFFFI